MPPIEVWPLKFRKQSSLIRSTKVPKSVSPPSTHPIQKLPLLPNTSTTTTYIHTLQTKRLSIKSRTNYRTSQIPICKQALPVTLPESRKMEYSRTTSLAAQPISAAAGVLITKQRRARCGAASAAKSPRPAQSVIKRHIHQPHHPSRPI